MSDFARAFSMLSVFLLLACAKTPDVPSLPGKQNPSIDQVLVGSEFTPSDARNIFAALNKNGRLNSLKNWFTAPDEDLSLWADIFNRYFYQEALQTDGALSLLEKRIGRSGFRAINFHPTPGELSALYSLLNYRAFPKLARQNASLLSPELYLALFRTNRESENRYAELGNWKASDSIDPEEGAKDLLSFFQDNKKRTALSQLGDVLEPSNFIENLLLALREQQAKYKSSAPFEGVAYGLGKNLANQETQKLFALLKLLNQPSDGIFSVAHNTLEKNPSLGKIFGKQLDPKIAKAAFRYVKTKIAAHPKEFWGTFARKELSAPPTKEFARFFTDVVDALNLLTSQSFDAPLLEKAPIYLASLVISERMEDILRVNNSTANFSVPEGSLNLLDPSEAGKPPRLSSRLSKDLEALTGMTPFREVLSTLVVQQTFGSTIYNFTEFKSTTFDLLLENTIKTVQETHRFADAAGLAMPILQAASLPESEAITIKSFETPNMLDSLHRFLGGISLEMWNRIDSLIFEEFKLGTLTEEEKQLYLQLWLPDESTMDRIVPLMNSIELLHTFNKPIQKSLPTPLGFCHGYLSNVRLKKEEIRALGGLMEFVSDAELLTLPYIYKNLESGRPVAKLLFQLSLLTAEEAKLFTSVLNSSLSRDLIRFMEEMSEKSPNELKTLASLLLANGRTLLPSLESLTPEERQFLIRFITSEDFEPLWKFFQKYSSRENIRALMNDLRGLLKDGGLLDAAELLSRIQNPLLKKFAGVVEKMVRSGEFEALLKALETIVPNSR